MAKVSKYDGFDRLEELEEEIAINTLMIEDLYCGHFIMFRTMPIPVKDLGIYLIAICN